VAVPGRVPCPAITGYVPPANSSDAADSPRYAPAVPIARFAAITTQPAEASPYDTIASTSSDWTGSSSWPPSSFGVHIRNS